MSTGGKIKMSNNGSMEYIHKELDELIKKVLKEHPGCNSYVAASREVAFMFKFIGEAANDQTEEFDWRKDTLMEF